MFLILIYTAWMLRIGLFKSVKMADCYYESNLTPFFCSCFGVEATIFDIQEKPLAVSKKQVYVSYFLLNGDKPNASCQHPA